MEVDIQYLGVVLAGYGVLVRARQAWSGLCKGCGSDVLDKGVKASLLPEGELLCNAALDVCSFDASMLVVEDTCDKHERMLRVPLSLKDAAKFGGQLFDDSGVDAALRREVEGV